MTGLHEASATTQALILAELKTWLPNLANYRLHTKLSGGNREHSKAGNKRAQLPSLHSLLWKLLGMLRNEWTEPSTAPIPQNAMGQGAMA